MADWQYLTPDKIEQLESLVKRTGFSWLSIYERFGSSVGDMTAVRAGKRPFAWGTWIPYLEAVVTAIEAIPVPVIPAYVPEGEPKPVTPSAASMTIEVLSKVLGRLFIEAEVYSPDEREAAQDAYGRVAEALGIEANVAEVVRALNGQQPEQVTASAPPRPVGMLREAV